MCGYGNAMSFKEVNKNDIASIENFIKNDAYDLYVNALSEKRSDDNESVVDKEKLTDIFGETYFANPSQFQFLGGDIKLIEQLVQYVKNVVDKDGINKGLQVFRHKKKNARKNPLLKEEMKENVTPRTVQMQAEILHDVTEMDSSPHSKH